MTAALFDTNIIIDLLGGVRAAFDEVEHSAAIAISVMTWMEVMVGIAPSLDAITRQTLAEFELIEIDVPIMERAVELRRGHRIKLTDAIIWASTQTRSMALVTRNTKDFPAGTPGVLVPYTI